MEGAALAVIGVALGGVAVLFATRLVQSWLFGIERGDPATAAGVAGSLIAVALVASLVPARQAMQVDPIIAMRAA